MNRWVLLEHKSLISNLENIHYDFLIENRSDCLTWKMFEIPLINKGFVEIVEQPNHRLIWLSRMEYELSNNRGLVKRIDHGLFINNSRQSNSHEFNLILNGNLLNGILSKVGNFCQLTKYD